MVNVLVLIDYSTEFSRRLFKGLIQYAKKADHWNFYRISSYYRNIYGEEGIIERARAWKADFIIAQWDYISITALENSGIRLSCSR